MKILSKVNPLPVALNDDFQFRKTKLFYLNENSAQGEEIPFLSALDQSE